MDRSSALKAVADVEVPVVVKLVETTLDLDSILRLRPGETIPFSKTVDQPLEIEVDGATVGEGFAVERGSDLGFRVSRLAGGSRPPASG